MSERPFSELSRDEQIDLMTAMVDGRVIECYNEANKRWYKLAKGTGVVFLGHKRYRLAE